MLSLRTHGLAFGWPADVPLFTDTSLHLTTGWTGVVGANGSGKTTLLRLLAGDLEPTDGAVQCTPAGTAVHTCPQRVDEPDAAIRRLADAPDRRAAGWLSRLELDPDALERWDTLSAGERKRWQVGAALAARPGVLLLDEPTNHLDADSRRAVVDALHRFDGIGVVVSHDRELLDTLTQATVRLAHRRVWQIASGYSAARAQWEADEAVARRERDSLDRQRKKLKRRLADKRRQRQAADAGISTRKRQNGPRDSDARSLEAKGRVRKVEARLGKEVGIERRRLARMEDRLADAAVATEHGSAIAFAWDAPRKRELTALDRPALHAGDTLLLCDVRVAVTRDSRIHLAGPNGSGKTTLLGALAAAASVPASRVVIVPQELDAAAGAALLDEVRAWPPDRRGELLTMMAALGVAPDRLLASACPSPGEVRKLTIAHGMVNHAWLLLLDEPTNHLDLPSIDRLSDALTAWPGALVVVSHDTAFAQACTTTRWRLADKRVVQETV